jgi:hypothetical protein
MPKYTFGRSEPHCGDGFVSSVGVVVVVIVVVDGDDATKR